MSQTKTIFFCTNCGNESLKWLGKCPACQEWNTLREETLVTGKSRKKKQSWEPTTKEARRTKATKIEDVSSDSRPRIKTPDSEFNRVLGGGIVPGSVILIGGHPGIGKSTLMLQIALHLAQKVLYVSGEESNEQIALRARRLGLSKNQCYLLPETQTSRIFEVAKAEQPELIIIDSIQTLHSPHSESLPGGLAQVRECAGEMQHFAKSSNIPIVLIGHITKDGNIAGPKLLEHIVDTVLQFEGDRNHSYRILRSIKNRFGSTDEIGIYEMHADGLREVPNPSEILLSQSDELLSGSTVAATMEGARPMLIEVQALVSQAVYGNPQRSTTGFDLRRLGMLLAVLEKRVGLPFPLNDVFLNMAGGIRIEDPAADLSIVAALMSSLENIPVPRETCFAAEVGLSGEVRSVNRLEQRIQEAERLGFKQIFVSKYNLKGIKTSDRAIQIVPIAKVEELFQRLFV